jgi:hypothetical protein
MRLTGNLNYQHKARRVRFFYDPSVSPQFTEDTEHSGLHSTQYKVNSSHLFQEISR